jgi:peptidoglycan/LPS O-acetylase OafA/YrhL
VQSSFHYRHFGAFRLLLAVLVVLQHFWANLAPEELTLSRQPLEVGSIAVLVFFCLSGFVIFEAADRIYQDKPIAFFANRLLRIVPHFLLAMSIAIFLCFTFFMDGTLRLARDLVFFGDSAFAVQNIILNLFGFLPFFNRGMSYDFIEIAWAIRVEMFFYILVAATLVVVRTTRLIGTERWDLFSVGFWVSVLFVPLFVMAMLGKAPVMFQLEPYFVFGCSLYSIAKCGSRSAQVIAGISLIGIVWQFLALPRQHPALGFERDVDVQFIMLFLLLAMMVGLAFVNFNKLRRLDRFLGDVTYPLYVSHINVMILLLSVTVGYSYTILYVGLAGSLLVAWAAHAVVDPAAARFRDFVRGRSLDDIWSHKPVANGHVDWSWEETDRDFIPAQDWNDPIGYAAAPPTNEGNLRRLS